MGHMKAGKGCQCCGTKDPRVLDFHHRDPAHKSFTLQRNNLTRSMDSILDEVDKRDVYCANCHRILHAEGRA